MAAVQPIPFGERNQGYTVEQLLTWHSKDLDSDLDDSSDSGSDSEVSSSPASSSDVSSKASSSSASSGDSSDQEDDSDADSVSDSVSDSDSSSCYLDQEDTSGQYSSDDGGRPAETLIFRRPRSLDAPKTLTRDVLDTLGDMARTDNVGFIAWLVPGTGICTMLGTELLACTTHFSCSEHFPTLSYAATFRPEGYAFTGGMCLTALFILTSVVLFFWYLQLRVKPHKQVDDGGRTTTVAGYVCLIGGAISAISLFGLAVMDMRTHHDAHVNFTIVFFISAWAMMIAVHSARGTILLEGDSGEAKPSLLTVLRRRAFWRSLRRWRRPDFFTSYTLGRLLLNTGLASTFLFGLFFLCANGVWPNPLGFTAGQEAFFEALAIVCQLLFMGTFSCELARLARLVEHRDYLELERSE
ncbi:hypothetical protein PRIC1_003995 [Phytophthora ramorum]